MLIGKAVVVRKEHEFGNRTYGEVWFQEESVRHLIVSKGWAEVNIKEKKVHISPLSPHALHVFASGVSD